MIRKIIFWKLALFGWLCTFSHFIAAQSVQYFVAPDGRDENPGTKENPFASLQQAREAVRLYKQRQGSLVDTTFVWLREGVYHMDTAFVLDSRDAGLPGAPVVYRAYAGERAIVRGGVEIPATAFQPIKEKHILKKLEKNARAHVLCADLKAFHITDFGQIYSRGMNIPVRPYPMELIFNEELMQVARWPNESYATYGKVTETGSIPRYRHMTIAPGGIPIDPDNPPPEFAPYINDTSNRPGSFLYQDDRPERWTSAQDVWLFGYWNNRWASQTLKISSINTKKKEIMLSEPHYYGLKDNGEFYAFNLLEEIDQPGEYYIDRTNGILYFWPPSDISQGKAIVSENDEAIVHLINTAHIILQNLTLEVSRGDCVLIEGGSDNLVSSCVVRHVGLDGIKIKETAKQQANADGISRNNGIFGCELYKIRQHGISLQGGDRRTLTPAGNFAVNNHLHDEADITLGGCGNSVAHNLIHDNPFGGIKYGGNNNLIEYNELYNCLTDADDWGVIYTGRNPSAQGNIIRFNYIHHSMGPVASGRGSNGIYLDDGTTGQIIYGNVIYKAGHPGKGPMGGVFVHGGKDNMIANNIFIDCELAIGFTPWSQERWEKFLAAGDMKRRLHESVDIGSLLYQERYPVLKSLEKEAGVNQVQHNLVVNCHTFMAQKQGKEVDHKVHNNWTTNQDPGFVNREAQDFRLSPKAEVYKRIPGFQPVPFEQMGLYQKNFKTAQ